MRTIELGDHKIEIYESLFEAPPSRVHKFHEYLILSSNISPSISEMAKKSLRVHALISEKKYKDAQSEALNLYGSVNAIAQGFSFDSMALCALIKSVDGVPFEEITEESLTKQMSLLDDWGLSLEDIVDIVETVKKNLNPSYL